MTDSRSERSREMRDGEKEDKDVLKDRLLTRERRKGDRDDPEKEKTKDRVREKDNDRDRHKDKERDRGSEKDRRHHEKDKDKDKERMKDREKDKSRDKDKDRDRDKERVKDREREKEKDREREKEKDREKQRERESGRDYDRVRSKDANEKEKGKHRARDHERQKSRDTDGSIRKLHDEDHNRRMDMGKDEVSRFNGKDGDDGDFSEHDKAALADDDNIKMSFMRDGPVGSQSSVSELEERILKMKEERLKKKSDGASEILGWVNKSRKIEEKKKADKAKALQLFKMFEEQDKIDQDDDDVEETNHRSADELGGAKVLHGLDKVLAGGSVILTLKDQSILSGDDINQEVDMLENVEIGEQKRRDDAYKAGKKKTGIYDQIDEPGSEKNMLPQYDDPMEEESVALDETGRFSGDAAKKLEELRRRIQGVTTKSYAEDLNSSSRVLTDYYTHEEMLQFKKPKKKKSLRKKEKLDINALEAEAISTGLGSADLGSRNDKTRQHLKEEDERAEAEKRDKAYKFAYEKAQEASKALRPEYNLTSKEEEDDDIVFDDDDDEELRKSLERARKLALRTQEEVVKSVPETIALLASTLNENNSTVDNNNHDSGDLQENKVVFTEMEEFVWGLQLDEDSNKPGDEDVFMEEDVIPNSPDKASIDEDGGWSEVKEVTEKETDLQKEDEEKTVPDDTIHEAAVGKGLSGALKLLKDRGSLKETIEWGGRNMDKKKSKLAGIIDEEGPKEIHIERTDEYGRILTPKEAFRQLSHKFHGKGPGKSKQEKRMRQYQEELKIKQMKNSDTPSQSVERMREAQEKLKTPYLVLSGNVKPGQTSDPRSGFATVEKDFPGSLTPMLGDKKVEHFLGIKRKPELGGDSALQKKPRN
ncbi:unnamed protein product [Cuscuta epithymum]|uniref:SART-1 family protein DOT2 n=2 Tax=Cuscuta epithymum TaxID=186058 RepID=A0AAV0FHG4_9ASTE|nr:unnamed protein product [Cuscuta epithymum]